MATEESEIFRDKGNNRSSKKHHIFPLGSHSSLLLFPSLRSFSAVNLCVLCVSVVFFLFFSVFLCSLAFLGTHLPLFRV